MSEPEHTPPPSLPRWWAGAVLVLLTLQLGLLWLHGTMLQRQHAELAALREDVQALAESLDQDSQDGGEEGAQPIRDRARRGALVPVALRQPAPPEPEEDKALKKDLEATRQSERDAVAQAREVRQKLSIEENARKADEKAKLEAAGKAWSPLVWAGLGVAVGALLVRSWLRRRG